MIESDANARLIAAAPDLLEALKDIISKFDEMNIEKNFESRRIFKAKQAIAKAEGSDA